MTLFGERFEPNEWAGARATRRLRPEDAFQRLVSDALKEDFGSSVDVFPTLGRDGGIDAFVLKARMAENHPLIPCGMAVIQCKYHDDGRPRLHENIRRGWLKYRRDLIRAEESGWVGPYSTWLSARAFIYCVSAGFPNASAKERLRAEIQDFFAEMSAGKKLDVQEVVLADWSDISNWLNRLASTRDAWIGMRLPGLVDHDTYMKGLYGFRKHLKSQKLPYIAPRPSSHTHPDAIVEKLTSYPGRNLVMVGPGGIGKTRTMLEVASRVQTKGWRVLHALPGEPTLSTEDLFEAISRTRSPTLVTMDYLNELRGVDLAAVRARGFPTVLGRNQRLAFLAAARPGWWVSAAAEAHRLFETVEITQVAAEQHQTSSRIVYRVAPNARRILGNERLIELCGTRPMIALLIATELERRATEGRLSRRSVVGLRAGDLGGWLRQRLDEDGIGLAEPRSVLRSRDPEANSAMEVAASILIAAPQTEERLLDSATLTLQAGGSLPAGEAHRLLHALVALGWLERSGGRLSSVHDVVVDEVVERAISFWLGESILEEALEHILDGAKSSVTTIHRYASALQRISADAEGAKANQITQVASRWLERNLNLVGPLLAHEGDRDVAVSALEAMLSGPPWRDAVERHWDEVVGPWLDSYGSSLPARSVILAGLSSVQCDRRTGLVAATKIWLDTHGYRVQGGPVLASYLTRSDLDEESRSWAVRRAKRWLRHHGGTSAASLVLRSLLHLDHLSGGTAAWVEREALNWLDRRNSDLSARFVLAGLLRRTSLDKAASAKATQHAQEWLAHYRHDSTADFVFNALIQHEHLSSEDRSSIADQSMSWLSRHADRPDIDFLLRGLLSRGDLDSELVARATRYALNWLSGHDTQQEVDYLLRALLRRKDLDQVTVAAVTAYALNWLDRHDTQPEADFLLRALLTRNDIKRQSYSAATIHAQNWLAHHGQELSAQFVLGPLLERKRLPPDVVSEAMRLALGWLALHCAEVGARFVLDALLRRDDLTEVEETAHLALEWLSHNPDESGARFVLFNLLQRRDLSSTTVAALVSASLSWLGGHEKESGASRVIAALLQHDGIDPTHAVAATRHAMAWLTFNGNRRVAGFVIAALFSRDDLESILERLDELRSDSLSLEPDQSNRLAVDARSVLGHHVFSWLSHDSYALEGLIVPTLGRQGLNIVESHLRSVLSKKVHLPDLVTELELAFSRLIEYESGVGAAVVDDLIVDWLHHPSALPSSGPQGPDLDVTGLVSRARSIAFSNRISERDWLSISARLTQWSHLEFDDFFSGMTSPTGMRSSP